MQPDAINDRQSAVAIIAVFFILLSPLFLCFCPTDKDIISFQQRWILMSLLLMIILSKRNMPGMDGKETSSKINKLYSGECTIVAMT